MKRFGGGVELARTRAGKHVVKQDWSSPVHDVLKQNEGRQIPTIGIGDAGSNVATRVVGLGANIVECLPMSPDEIQLGTLDTASLCSPKGLGIIAPHLFNLEPRSRSEKTLGVDLDLYQMEKL
jgi:hypothetical protein